jgi:hypothetical protein
VQQPVEGTGGNSANDDNPSGKASAADTGNHPTGTTGANPCVLVSAAQAAAFTGKAVAVKEAPLGPTCIYQASGAREPITLAVERVNLSTLKRHIRKLTTLTIGGRLAYCGVYGTAITYVSLPGHRVLSVTGPCAVGKQFATAAVPKLA